MSFIISAYGVPAPQGSKKHVGGGRLVESNQKKLDAWRGIVHDAAVAGLETWPGHDRDAPAFRAYVVFSLPRPKGHYGTGRNAGFVKASAPTYPAVKPDLDKLIRSTFDALSDAGVWRDDAAAISVDAFKRYVTANPIGTLHDFTRPGAFIALKAVPT